MRWNPANDRVYCAVGYPDAFGAVAVIDGASNVMVDSVMLRCQMPGGIAVDDDHNRIFCAGSSSYPLDESLVTVIDGAQRQHSRGDHDGRRTQGHLLQPGREQALLRLAVRQQHRHHRRLDLRDARNAVGPGRPLRHALRAGGEQGLLRRTGHPRKPELHGHGDRRCDRFDCPDRIRRATTCAPSATTRSTARSTARMRSTTPSRSSMRHADTVLARRRRSAGPHSRSAGTRSSTASIAPTANGGNVSVIDGVTDELVGGVRPGEPGLADARRLGRRQALLLELP